MVMTYVNTASRKGGEFFMENTASVLWRYFKLEILILATVWLRNVIILNDLLDELNTVINAGSRVAIPLCVYYKKLKQSRYRPELA
jgi:hypothetical protein